MNQNLAYAAVHLNLHDDTVDVVRRGESLATEAADGGPETGARALMRAVLQDAILCLRGHATGVPRRERQRAIDQAYCWIAARDTTWTFSFETICHVLGLDAGRLRRRLLSEVALGKDSRASGDRTVWHEGGMVSRLRSYRMRGNQRKGTIRPRRRRRRSTERSLPRPRAAAARTDEMAS